MRGPFLLRRLLKELDRAPRGAGHGGASESRRDETVARMKRLQRDGLRERGKAFWWAKARWIVAAAALTLAGVILVAGLWTSSRAPDPVLGRVRLRAALGLVEVSHGGSRDIVGADARLLSADDTVETHAGAGASLFLPSGATFSMGERASLQVEHREPAQEAVQLGLGRIDVHVPKLEKGASFVVTSAHATVTVRGTRFAVIVEGAAASSLVTRVEVTEGVVAVASRGKTVELRSGDRWSSSDLEARATADEPPPGAKGAVAPQAPLPAAAAAPVDPREVASAGRPQSTLGSENELLSQAMSASAAGDDAGALTLLGAFLAKHPRSPLAENATVERLRLLARSGSRAGAARAARSYLARYPEGIGRDLARRLATDGTDAPSSAKQR